MFTDPLPGLSFNGTAISLVRIKGPDSKGDTTESVYASADGVHTLTITQQTTPKGRRRVTVRYERQITVTDPYTSLSRPDKVTEYSVSDYPIIGPSSTDIQNQVAALQGWKTAANVLKLFAKEA